MKKTIKESPKVLGLDVSTKTIFFTLFTYLLIWKKFIYMV